VCLAFVLTLCIHYAISAATTVYEEKKVYIEAFQFGYKVVAVQDGENLTRYRQGLTTLRLNAGDRVTFFVSTQDVVHGFNIEGYTDQIKDRLMVIPGRVLWVGPITFNEAGKFRIKCTTPCGALHPFMSMDIIVEPNIPYYTLSGSVILTAIASLLYISSNSTTPVDFARRRKYDEIDLLKVEYIGKVVKRLIKSRSFHFSLIVVNLFFFVLIIVSGLFGSPTGSENFSIAVTWILWFAAVEFMILFAGRIWCSVCPIPVIGEWISRRGILNVNSNDNKSARFGRKGIFPRKYRNMWIPALGFLVLSLFIPWLVTRPVVTSLLFLSLFVTAIYFYLRYPGRYFCKHICPASGYIGYHSTSSILAVRCRSRQICMQHRNKDCIKGNSTGYGCPWKLYPGNITENTYCGMCFECFRSCLRDNMTLKIRMIGIELPEIAKKAAANFKKRLDEVSMGYIRFSLAIFYEIFFFGSIFWLKDFGNLGNPYGANLETMYLLFPTMEGIIKWMIWAGTVLSLIAGIMAMYYLHSLIISRISGINSRKLFVAFSYSLSPYGLFIWMGFAISLLLTFINYPVNAFLDPFGYADVQKISFYLPPKVTVILQIPFLMSGLSLAIISTYRIAREITGDRAVVSTLICSIPHTVVALIIAGIIAGW